MLTSRISERLGTGKRIESRGNFCRGKYGSLDHGNNIISLFYFKPLCVLRMGTRRDRTTQNARGAWEARGVAVHLCNLLPEGVGEGRGEAHAEGEER